jgi:hypothetical protein
MSAQREWVSTTNVSLTLGVGLLLEEAFSLGGHKERTNVIDKLLKLSASQSSQGVEHVLMRL